MARVVGVSVLMLIVLGLTAILVGGAAAFYRREGADLASLLQKMAHIIDGGPSSGKRAEKSARINASAWELLLAMLVREAAFGQPGVIAAPVFYAYAKAELVARKLLAGL